MTEKIPVEVECNCPHCNEPIKVKASLTKDLVFDAMMRFQVLKGMIE